MRLTPRHWHNETWICSLRGHVAPAAMVAQLTENDRRFGIDLSNGLRHCRCLRCDTWVQTAIPAAGDARWATMPSLDELPLPRRGKVLQDAILLRIVALNKAAHATAFGLFAAALLVIQIRLVALKSSAADLESLVTSALDSAGRNPARQALATGARRVLGLNPNEIKVLLGLCVLYFVVESIEAVGLWKERRWAEYVTAIATAGFLPLEVHELIDRLTVLRVGALVINVAMLGWLLNNKHLFGIRGGASTLHEHMDWSEVLDTFHPAVGRSID